VEDQASKGRQAESANNGEYFRSSAGSTEARHLDHDPW
jgi:hypothetical protein